MKIGEKVKVKNILREGCNYSGMQISTNHKLYRNNIREIVSKEYDTRIGNWVYTLKGIEDIKWTYTMFNPDFKDTSNEQTTAVQNGTADNPTAYTSPEQTVVNNNIDFSQVVGAIETLTSKINERTLYDDTMQQRMKEKVLDISDEEIVNDINKKVDKYIKDNYGILPTQKVEVNTGEVVTQVEGTFHSKFEDILKIVSKGVPLMLTGPAGSGKNYTLEQVAKALDLDFYFTNAVTQEFKLTGFIDANGKYQETQFYKAFKDGGLFFLDEIDASSPEALVILNAAIANGYFDFPCGRVNANENFRVVCAGNTYGTGADMIYVGRNQLDGATLDRFTVITFDYDANVEKQLAYDEELYTFIKTLREVINKNSLRYIISMRATINATKLIEVGMDKKDILISAIIKNMQLDDLNVITNELSNKLNGNEWYSILRGVINDRNQ